MLKGAAFRNWVGIIGVVGASLLVVYLLLVALVPAVETMAVAVAAPGGLLNLVWTLVVGIQLLRMRRAGTGSAS
jgi:hypothetical protein